MRKLLLFISTFLVLATTLSAAELTTEVNRKQIYIGESVILSVNVNGYAKEKRPDLSSIKNSNIEYLGSHSQNRSSITMINGKITKDVFVGRTYRFAITPRSTGRQTIGPIYFQTDKENLKAPPINIQVQGVEKQDNVIIKVEASRKQVLIDSEFNIIVKIYVKKPLKLDPNVAPFNPQNPPVVEIPFLDKGDIPGLKIPDINKLLSPLIVSSRDSGIAINDFSVRNAPFDLGSMFNHPSLSGKQLAKFRLPKKEEKLNNIKYIVYSLNLKYTAEELGTYTFGPIVFKGTIITDVFPPDRVAQKNIFAVGPAETVEVIPPPEENRPESYIGAMGKSMAAKASLDNQTCNVGDPLKLSIDVTGEFRKDIVYPPEISADTNITTNFRVYEETAKNKKIDNGRRFSWTIRPINDGNLEIPPIKLSYFNLDKNDYETIETDPIPVRAIKNQEADESLVIMTSTNKVRLNNTIETETIQVRDVQPTAVTMSPSGATQTNVYGNIFYIYIFLIGPGLFVVILLTKIVVLGVIHNSSTYKRRKALNIFQTSTRNVIKRAKTSPKDAAEQLYKDIQAFFGNKYDKTTEGLTPMDIQNIFNGDNSEMVKIIEKYFNSAYASHALTAREINADVQTLIDEFTKL
jgi:hypothetical protein